MALGRMLPSALCQGVGVLKLGVFRGSITWPVVPPVYASYPALRPCPQDSEPAWLARPSPYDSFIRYILPDRSYSIVASNVHWCCHRWFGAYAPGWRFDTSSPIGSCWATLGICLDTYWKQAAYGTAGANELPPGALCVNVLIHQGLRRMRHLRRCRRARDIRCASGAWSGVCPVVLWGSGAPLCGKLQARCAMEYDTVAREGLHLWSQEQGQIGRGDLGRRAATRELFEKQLREERTARASAVGFAATVTEPFRSRKSVRARITTRQAPFRKERGTPCGYAALRGVDRPRPRP